MMVMAPPEDFHRMNHEEVGELIYDMSIKPCGYMRKTHVNDDLTRCYGACSLLEKICPYDDFKRYDYCEGYNDWIENMNAKRESKLARKLKYEEEQRTNLLVKLSYAFDPHDSSNP